MIKSPEIDLRLRGGEDAWDDGPAGALQTAEYFAAAPSSGTFGDTTAGSSTFPASNDRAVLTKFTVPADCDITTVYLRFDNTSLMGTNAKALVYADAAGVPGARLGVSGEALGVPMGGGVLSFDVSVTGLTAGQEVWLGGVTDNFTAVWQVDPGAALSRMEGTTYASPAATWTQSGTSANGVNAWADYVPSAGGTGYTLAADGGSFTVSGAPAGALAARRLVADASSYVLTGQDAAFATGKRIAADAGGYALSGQDASLRADRRLTADAGTAGIAGQDAGLRAGRFIAADSGAAALSGASADLRAGRSLAADSGGLALSGQPASLIVARTLLADGVAFAIAGNDATLVHGTVGSYTLIANEGGFSLTGADATLTYAPVSSGEPLRTGGGAGLRLVTPGHDGSIRRALLEAYDAAQAMPDVVAAPEPATPAPMPAAARKPKAEPVTPAAFANTAMRDAMAAVAGKLDLLGAERKAAMEADEEDVVALLLIAAMAEAA